MTREKIFVVIILSFFTVNCMAQKNDLKEALLVIDIQEFYFPGGDIPLMNPEKAADNAAELLKFFRSYSKPVFFIRHNYKPGGAIHESVKPVPGEQVMTKSNVNAFVDTELGNELMQMGIKTLVICGMQTHMCVEAAVRAASDMGYECILIHDACTTRDLSFEDKTVRADEVHLSTLSTLKSYARVMSTIEYLNR